MNDTDGIMDEAAVWHARTASDAMDWAGFTAWLERDPRHRQAYDEIALADAILSHHAQSLNTEGTVAANPPRVGKVAWGWRVWGRVAVAASLIATVAGPLIFGDPQATYTTGSAGQPVVLADGSRIMLAPHSRMTVDAKQTRIALDGGAYFSIRHDPGRALTVAAGGVEITDIGTAFDVQSDKEAVRIGVASGQIAVTSNLLEQPVTLRQGSALTFDAMRHTATVRKLATGEAGSWQSGRLTYVDAPLSLVVHDLRRYAGLSVTLAAGLEDRRFSGTLALGNGQSAVRDLAQLVGLELHAAGSGYRLDRPTR